jgi:transposase
MAIERKQYSAEFKQEAVRLMTQGGQSSSLVAQELGINQGLLNKWKRQLNAAQQAQSAGRQNYEDFRGQGRAHDEELARLQLENAALMMERNVLLSAIAIFAEAKPR